MSDQKKISLFLGSVTVNPTSATHIFVSTNSDEKIIVNRVELTVGAHYHLWADGAWHVGPEDNHNMAQWHALYLTKVNRKNYNDDPSRAAREKVAEVLTPLVNAWVLEHPQMMIHAELSDLENQIERAKNKALETRTAAELAQQALEALELKLADAKGEPTTRLTYSQTWQANLEPLPRGPVEIEADKIRALDPSVTPGDAEYLVLKGYDASNYTDAKGGI